MAYFERRDIIYDEVASSQFDRPHSAVEIGLEERLCGMDVSNGRISGAAPMAMEGLPTNASKIKFKGQSVLVVPEDKGIVVLGMAASDAGIYGLIKKLGTKS